MPRNRTAIAVVCGAALVAGVMGIALITWVRGSVAGAPLVPPTPVIPNNEQACGVQANARVAPTVAASRTRSIQTACLPKTNASAATLNPADLGLPAIRPTRNVTGGQTPTFTVKDVEQYVATGTIGPKISANGPSKVVNVQFLPAQQVEALLKTTTASMPPDRLLCVAELSGNYTISGPPSAVAPSTTFTTVYLVFDAQTGNLVVEKAG